LNETSNLRTRAIKSTAWLFLLNIGTQGVSWVVTIVIARFLTTADYGLFAMALTVVGAFELFRELGLGSAIIQRQDISRQHLNTLFWLVAALSVALLGVLFALAEPAARFYGEPRLGWIVPTLGVTLLFNALGFIPYSLLTKEIDFRRRSLAAAVGVAASAVTSITLAFMGYGVGALIAGQLVNSALMNTTLLIVSQWRPGASVSFSGIGDVLRLGVRLASVGVINAFSPIVNRALVGRLLGGPALGLYSMGESVAEGPQRISSSVIHQLSLPVFSKLQREAEELLRYFLKITKYLAITSVPAQVGMALVAHDMITLLLSARWTPMVTIFQFFCIGACIRMVTLPAAPLLVARNRSKTLLRINWTFAVLFPAAILAGAQWSLVGVGIAWLVVSASHRFALISVALHELRLPLLVYLRNMAAPLVAAATMALAVLAVSGLEVVPSDYRLRLAACVATGAIVYLITLAFIDGHALGSELKAVLRDLRSRSKE
jgi:PST family polysaccharide transporter